MLCEISHRVDGDTLEDRLGRMLDPKRWVGLADRSPRAQGAFGAFLGGLRDRRVRARIHGDWVPEPKAMDPPPKPKTRREIPGRAGQEV